MTGVDVARPDCDLSDVTFAQMTASRFVHEYKGDPYDFVVVDLYNGNRIPEFVFYESFVDELSRLCGKLLAVNLTFYNFLDFKVFDRRFIIDCVKRVNCGNDQDDEDKVMFLRRRP